MEASLALFAARVAARHVSRRLRVDFLVNPSYNPRMSEEFGKILRDLRTNADIGIKRLAPELGVTYTYLSKLENNQVRPSEEFVGRVAHYFQYDHNQLLLAANKVPPDVLRILRDHPMEAIDLLRERFGRHDG